MEWNWAGSDIFAIHTKHNGFRILLKGVFPRRGLRLRTIKMIIVEGFRLVQEGCLCWMYFEKYIFFDSRQHNYKRCWITLYFMIFKLFDHSCCRCYASVAIVAYACFFEFSIIDFLTSVGLSFSSSSGGFSGLCIHNIRGKNSIKNFRTQGAIWCVTGDLKFTFSTTIVTTTDNVTSIIVNNKYFPSKGTVRDVGGIISANNKKNTVRESRIDIQSEIFSPESDGR